MLSGAARGGRGPSASRDGARLLTEALSIPAVSIYARASEAVNGCLWRKADFCPITDFSSVPNKGSPLILSASHHGRVRSYVGQHGLPH